MIKFKILLIATICGMLLMAGCSKEDTPAAKVSDQETAEQFAWAVVSSVRLVAPSSDSRTWSDATLSGAESGSAVVNGSFTYNYNSYSGRKDETYNYVVIQFNKYCDSSYDPHLTGTVIIDGTCTTQYGWNTTYSGQWELVGMDLQLSGKLSGSASIAVVFRNGGLDWAAIVETSNGTWSVSN
jgi:major membrane immunogen (membrane-anchored lipoprotein)